MNGLAATSISNRQRNSLAFGGATLLWLAQPPCAIWPLAFIAIVPWLRFVSESKSIGRRGYLVLWLASSLYWLISLQGLRHAHPLMYGPWLALGMYLGCYLPVFVAVSRRLVSRRWPMVIAAPIVWVGLECLRGYLVSGLSALMLGHLLVDVPHLIQIADLFGSYGISFVVVAVNVAALELWLYRNGTLASKHLAASLATATALLIGSAVYGHSRLKYESPRALASFLLVQRDEPIEFDQPSSRAAEIFRAYARHTVDAAGLAARDIDAIVWPESMFTGQLPWIVDRPGADVTALPARPSEMRDVFLQRASEIQRAAANHSNVTTPPHLLVGCGVVEFAEDQHSYSGLVHVSPEGNTQWYGKTHLVMFGEYIPLVPSIPIVRNLIPPGMGVWRGEGPKLFDVTGTKIAPNICIETAVERVTISHLQSLMKTGEPPDVIVTVTNDGWFDESSVLEHHLRCAQIVAVGTRRPILSAANSGPTASIDSSGRIRQKLPQGTNGAIVAEPPQDARTSLYVRIGDWPSRVLAAIVVLTLLSMIWRRRTPLTDPRDS